MSAQAILAINLVITLGGEYVAERAWVYIIQQRMAATTRLLVFVLMFTAMTETPTLAQTGKLADDLVGAWEYHTAHQVLPDGQWREQFSHHPKGMLIILPNGWYSHIVMRDDLPRVASRKIARLSAEEQKAIAAGQLSHYGTWDTDGQSTFRFHVKWSTFPNLNGVVQQRKVLLLTRDVLQYENYQTTAGKGSKVFAELHRVW